MRIARKPQAVVSLAEAIAVPGVECLEALMRSKPEVPSCDTERELSTCITGASVVDAKHGVISNCAYAGLMV